MTGEKWNMISYTMKNYSRKRLHVGRKTVKMSFNWLIDLHAYSVCDNHDSFPH
jgi:hypothetical protein